MIKKKSRHRRCCGLLIRPVDAFVVSAFLLFLLLFLSNYVRLVLPHSDLKVFQHVDSSSSQQQQQQQKNSNNPNSNKDTPRRRRPQQQLQESKKVTPSSAQSPYGGAFVHMGKTGGSTISVLLRNGCHSYMKHPCRNISKETAASQLIQSYYHVPDFGLLPQSQHDFYLVSIRDPLDRVISSFVYEHYLNRLARNNETETTTTMDPVQKVKLKTAFSCFPTLEQFASYFDSDPNGEGDGDPTQFHYPYPRFVVNADSCQDLARAALYGRVKIFGHLYFGYERIRSLLLPSSDNKNNINNNKNLVLYVTRQERMQHDWETVNRLLGKQQSQNDAALDPLPHRKNLQDKNVQLVMPVTRQLSKQGTLALCRALIKGGEYQAYLWFLEQARNMQADDVTASIHYVSEKCGPVLVTSLGQV